MLHFITQILEILYKGDGIFNIDYPISDSPRAPERKSDLYCDTRSEDYLLERWPDEY